MEMMMTMNNNDHGDVYDHVCKIIIIIIVVIISDY